jgi:hypothetical protein
MKKLIILTIGFALLFSCSEKKEKTVEILGHSFNLEKDIFNFSDSMRNGDTIFLNAKMGVCLSHCEEHNIIYKLNDSIFIQSKYVETSPRNYAKDIEKTLYKYNKSDTLNLEDLITSIRGNRTKRNYYIKYTYQVIYKRDTIEFFTYGLISTLKKMEYYNRIKERIYPNEELYKPVQVPVEHK